MLVETSGAFDVSAVDARAHRIMDLKCPGSGEEERNDWANLELLDPARDELKFVISDREDYDWAVAQIDASPYLTPISTILKGVKDHKQITLESR